MKILFRIICMSTISEIRNNTSSHWLPMATRLDNRYVTGFGVNPSAFNNVTELVGNFFKQCRASSPPNPSQALSLTTIHPANQNLDKWKIIFPNTCLSPGYKFQIIKVAGVGIVRDIWLRICEFITSSKDILSLTQTCKSLVGLREDTGVLSILWRNLVASLQQIVHGREAWNIHYGDVGEVDPIPEALLKALEKPCPFIRGKKVKETHIACWIPTHVNGSPLTLNRLGEIAKKPLKGPKSGFLAIEDKILSKHGEKPNKKGRWILLTLNIIKESGGKEYTEQKQLVESYEGYGVPDVLSAATALFMRHVTTKSIRDADVLFKGDYSYCQEECEGRHFQISSFQPAYSNVDSSHYSILSISYFSPLLVGVRALCEF